MNSAQSKTGATIMDWSEPYLKLEQSHKALKDALNQERYEDAEDLLFSIMGSTDDLYGFVIGKMEIIES